MLPHGQAEGQSYKPPVTGFTYSSAELLQAWVAQTNMTFILDVKFSFGTGICTGMAVASLAYYVGINTPPRPTTTFSLTLDQAWPTIATRKSSLNSLGKATTASWMCTAQHHVEVTTVYSVNSTGASVSGYKIAVICLLPIP